VIYWPTGSARETFDVPGIVASGKTGTAEFCDEYPQCLDRDGRVTTSHAWFTSYAPSNNPEIVTVVFVYGGGEGSAVAVPVTNRMLRYYFGIADEVEEEPADEVEETVPALVPEQALTARLLGTDTWNLDGANVSGYVLDTQGQGVAGITIDVIIEGEVVTQLVSSPTGQFDYNLLDPTEADMWQFRLPDFPQADVLQLDLNEGLRYLVEFKAQIGGA
jgi:hypothetical protein